MDMMKFVSIPYYALDRATNDSDFDVIAITLGVINIPTLITVTSTHCDSKYHKTIYGQFEYIYTWRRSSYTIHKS